MKKRILGVMLTASLVMTSCGFSMSDAQENIDEPTEPDVPDAQEEDDSEEIPVSTDEEDNSTKTVTCEVHEYNKAVNEKEIPSNIFDDDLRTKWCSPVEQSGTYVIWKASSPVAVNGYAITTANDNSRYPGRNPLSWTLYGCNSDTAPDADSDWTVIDQRIGDKTLPDADFQTRSFEVQTNAPEYQYFMLKITETAGANVFQISEFKINYSEDFRLLIKKDGDGQIYDKLEADLKMVFDAVYEKMAAEYNPDAPKTVIAQIKKDTDNGKTTIANTSANVVTVGIDYYAENQENYDVFTHELAHVVQMYTMSVPLWLTEGIADYIRYQYGINNEKAGWALPEKVGNDQKYTSGYGVTAAFLKWIEENVREGTVKEISSLITKGEYKESDWERITGSSLNGLWEAYVDSKG